MIKELGEASQKGLREHLIDWGIAYEGQKGCDKGQWRKENMKGNKELQGGKSTPRKDMLS